MYITRLLNLSELLTKKSFFLFGPRSTGKSLLIKKQLEDRALILNLLRNDLYLRLKENPSSLEAMLPSDNAVYVVIDEVQRIPELLNEVHRLIEEKNYRFLLTGSSARKLLKSDANLLAGRARKANLFPFTYQELAHENQFSLKKYLLHGGLPQVYLSEEPHEELMAYIDTYLQDEIQREALVRNVSSFTRFFSMCASTSGQIINFTAIASSCSVPYSTVREYYQILEDTLIGFMLPAWTGSLRKKTIKSAKFYLFDVGVSNYLNGIKEIPQKSTLFGHAFEHFIMVEVRSFISYSRKNYSMAYWRTSDGAEVDLILNDEIAIEIKATEKITDKHCSGLRSIMQHKACKKYLLISQDKFTTRLKDDIQPYYWEDFLKALWQDAL